VQQWVVLSLLALLAMVGSAAHADDALVAVASNFTVAIDQLEPVFERGTGHRLTVIKGSTGKLYAQIVNGAPFDVFLAADQRRPALLEQADRTVAGSRFSYAIGLLSLWSRDVQQIGSDGVATLTSGTFRKLAIANPDLAPYGAAARETLETLGVYPGIADRLVMGENIGQTYAMVATGNADLGFVARSFLSGAGDPPSEGSRWDVPAALHSPIRQDVVLLRRAANNVAARAFLTFLADERARALIRAAGYGLD
jgi:molybdate transport system substrate-binding protein